MPLKMQETKHPVVFHDKKTIISFGKHKGRTVGLVLQVDPKYLVWAYENIDWFDLDAEVFDIADRMDDPSPLFVNGYDYDGYGWADPDDYPYDPPY